MYQFPDHPGVLPTDPRRRSQFHVLTDAAALSGIPADELKAVLNSAAKTYTRGAYHEARFVTLRRELDQRRELLPGEVIWDNLIEYVHFELQAFAGACRTLLDELVYIIARRHGASRSRARQAPWHTADLCKKELPVECTVPEVQAIRNLESWFDTLNAFRNTFFHHGWRHGGGHFSAEDLRASTQSPASNGLLVPDRESLRGRSKPFEWTWTNRTTVDEVALQVRQGTERLLDDILGSAWGTPIPPPGTAPMHERPNVMVVLVRPAFLETPLAVFLPIFSTRELGLAFGEFSNNPAVELVDAPTSSLVIGQRAVSITLAGIEHNEMPAGASHIEVVLDPIADARWTQVKARLRTKIDLRELIAKGTHTPVSFPIPQVSRVWLWKPIDARSW